MLRYDDTRSLPLLLHVNSEPWMNLQAYAAQSAEVPFPVRVPGPQCVALPPAGAAAATGGTLGQAIVRRRSARNFEDRPLAGALLSRLLAWTYGVGEVATLPDGTRVLQRPLPSAGALYPLELHLMLSGVDGVPDGIFRYEPLHHRLEPRGPLPAADALAAMLLVQPYAVNARAIVFFVGLLERNFAKYGMRAYRYLLLEAGHAAQNLCLLATDAGLGSLCIGGFRDHLIQQALGVDAREAITLYAVAVGWPAGEAR